MNSVVWHAASKTESACAGVLAAKPAARRMRSVLETFSSEAPQVVGEPCNAPRREAGLRRPCLLERADCGLLQQQIPELIHTLEQALAGKGFDFEGDGGAIGQFDARGLQIDNDLAAFEAGDALPVGVGDDDGQHAVLERVVAEDVGDAGGDHRADAVVVQRPGRVFARRAAAEVAAGGEDAGAAQFGAMQGEVGALVAFGVEAPVGEAALADAGALRGGEEARGDDLVGVDVFLRQHGDHGFESGERFHQAASSASGA